MGRFRDAVTGLFTTKAHAEASPGTTVHERAKVRAKEGSVAWAAEQAAAELQKRGFPVWSTAGRHVVISHPEAGEITLAVSVAVWRTPEDSE